MAVNANVPAVVENHLDTIHCSADGKVILTSSNLTGRYWNGSLWCFESVDDAPNVEKCLAGTDVSAGVCDLVELDNSVFALGLDSGGIEVYKLDAKPANFSWTFGANEHDDYVTSLSLNSDKSNLVSSGADKCIKIWDTKTWSTTGTYNPVHDGIIWQVACSTTDPNLFVTCGQDGKVLLFDLRLPKPASLLDNDPLKGEPSAVSWKPGDSNTFAVGDDSGLIALKDTRNAGSLCSWNAHKRRIHRMTFSKSQTMIASCADCPDITVMNIEGESPVQIYKNDNHDDFVRGLAWTKENELVSCGWDKKVLKHIVK